MVVRFRSRQVREIAVIVPTVLLLTWVLQTFVGRQYVVPSESMEPTLHGCSGCSNDRIVIEKLSHLLGDAPRAGDVIVFVAPTDSWNENWTSPRSSNAVVGADFGPVLVPAHGLWVMGDNRTHSAASRFHITDERQGTVPVSAVRGKVVAKIWPASSWSVVHSLNPQR